MAEGKKWFLQAVLWPPLMACACTVSFKCLFGVKSTHILCDHQHCSFPHRHTFTSCKSTSVSSNSLCPPSSCFCPGPWSPWPSCGLGLLSPLWLEPYCICWQFSCSGLMFPDFFNYSLCQPPSQASVLYCMYAHFTPSCSPAHRHAVPCASCCECYE